MMKLSPMKSSSPFNVMTQRVPVFSFHILRNQSISSLDCFSSLKGSIPEYSMTSSSWHSSSSGPM